MVSSSAAQAHPNLSYADRAKKAQSIKPPSIPLQPPALAPAVAAPPTLEITPSPTSTSLTRPVSPLPPDPNGDALPITTPSNVTSSTGVTPAQKPVVNVWSLRAQAQAQSRASQPPSKSLPQTQPRPSTSTSSLSISPVLPLSRHPADSISTKTVARDNNNPRPVTSNFNPPMSINGVTAPISPTDDPFVVRPGRAASISASNSISIPPPIPVLSKKPTVAPLVPPPPDDVESWPEVGKSTSASLAPSTLPTPGGSGSEKEDGSVNGSTHGGKKSMFHFILPWRAVD